MDNWLDLNTVNLLGRVDSRINKNNMISAIARAFRLGEVISYNQIHEGFEDYNVKLKTSKGIYFVKVFSQFKSFRHIKDNIEILVKLSKKKIRVPKILKTYNGQNLFHYETKEGYMALASVMEFFAGKSFFKTKREPTITEIISLTKELAKINKLSFKPLGIYDTWVVQNLETEFNKKREFLTTEDKRLTEKAIQKISRIDYSKCTKGFLHNDIQRSNVLINNQGEIRVIDFSVMEYGPIIIDIATFIALFCLDINTGDINRQKLIINTVLDEYQQLNKLNKYEKKILPILILGTYAANNLAASFEKIGKNNNSEETLYWQELGRKGMLLINKLFFN